MNTTWQQVSSTYLHALVQTYTHVHTVLCQDKQYYTVDYKGARMTKYNTQDGDGLQCWKFASLSAP